MVKDKKIRKKTIEEFKRRLKLTQCDYDPDTGAVVCKVDPELYDKIRSGKIVNSITFEIAEKK